MSDNSECNSAINAVATTKINHAQLGDLPLSTLKKLRRGGIRPGEAIRTITQARKMLDKVPYSQQAGIDGNSAGANTKKYLSSDKHASHIKPHSKGGSNHPKNIKWENAQNNVARRKKAMAWEEQIGLNANWHFDNLSGAVKAGIKATPMGAAIGAATTAPLSLFKNAFRVMRGEISSQEAAVETVKDTLTGGVVGGATAFATTAVAAACPPIAIAVTAAAPALLVVGTAGMVYEFFKILDHHKQAVKTYYESLTQQELERLQEIEDELLYEHAKNLEFLAETKVLNDEIKNRPCEPGVEGALKRYLESVAIAKSLGVTPDDSNLLAGFQQPLLPPNY